MVKIKRIPATLIRGGTSKGLFFDENDLPSNQEERDKLLLAIMGSPDPTGMQLNGMGGGISSTSKVAIISRSKRSKIDINYLFGQVDLREPKIDWQGGCGNLAAAAGLFAIEKGFVKTEPDGSAKISIWQANLNHEICLEIASSENERDLISIPGVPGKSAAIYVEFIHPNDSLIPGKKPIHIFSLPNGQKIEGTIIQGVNPTIFVKAFDLGLSGKELPEEIDFKKLGPIIKALSIEGASIMQIPYSSAIRVAWVAPPVDYTTSDGVKISKKETDILSRISTEGRVHHAHTGTGAINLACAMKIPHSIPFQMMSDPQMSQNQNFPVRIGHPKGVILVNAKVVFDDRLKTWVALSSGFMRTAKILMVGKVCI